MDTEMIIGEAKEFFEENKKEIIDSIKDCGYASIDLSELMETHPGLMDYMLDDPEVTLELLDSTVNDSDLVDKPVHARLRNIPDSFNKHIARLRTAHLNRLISFEGVVRQRGEVKSRIVSIKYECPSCGTIISVRQTGKEIASPSSCSCGRRGSFKELTKDSIDEQILIVEETHENTERNNQPAKIKVILHEDLCGISTTAKNIPGTLVRITGVLNEERKYGRKGELTLLERFIEVNNIEHLEDDEIDMDLTEEERVKFREIAKSPNAVDLISKCIAPSVHGYDEIKQALAFQLFGGVSSKRNDGTYTREMIHGLLVGDPGTAKSVMLRFMSSATSRGRFVSGKGASGVGLTAAVKKSEITGDWALEAGAMVLANGSIMAVDEGDKMDEADRSNLHEGMSLGTITINKAGLGATLPARTSVLMAANPKRGRFNHKEDLISQINLVPSLLSRFDFVYIIKDKPHEDGDMDIAMKILEQHSEEQVLPAMDMNELRKYINMAKQIDPIMTKEAKDVIAKFYVDLRKQTKEAGDGSLIIPITPRQLESLVRLAEAHARLKMRKHVGPDDAKHAVTVMRNYLKEFGYDAKSGSFDVDKIMGMSSNTRNNLDIVLRTIRSLEGNHLEKFVPAMEIENVLRGKVEIDDIYKAIGTLNLKGDILKQGSTYKRV